MVLGEAGAHLGKPEYERCSIRVALQCLVFCSSNGKDLQDMSQMELVDKEFEFHWGKKRGTGGAKKDIKFYESFTFDGIEYCLFDCVYLYSKDEVDPYIGKIVKIWEQPDGKRKVKILWLFLANEITTYLGDHETLGNEIFLASGEGVGACNINPLEAIAGKCYVVCTSKDERNLQPSKEASDKADYIFYRTFDVGNFTISDKLPEKIINIEVKLLLNREADLQPNPRPRLEASVVEGRLEKNEADVLVNSSKPESLKSLEDKVKGDKFEQITSPVSKIEVIEKKHLNEGKRPDEKIFTKLKYDSANDGEMKNNGTLGHTEENSKSSKRAAFPAVSGEKPSKKIKPSDDSVRPSADIPSKASTGTRKLQIDASDEEYGNDAVKSNKESSEKVKLNEKKAVPAVPVNNEPKVYNKFVEVTRKPVTEINKWFNPLPWDSRFKNSDAQGTLVLLDNLDPSYTSAEIEDIIYSALKLHCSAKVIQQGTFQSPHNGQAYVIFKTADAAEQAVQQLDTGCLMLPDGRPVLASRGLLKVPLPKPTHVGHLAVDKLKLKQHDEWKKAVATSHCSQPNTIEYEMSMDWILLQEKSAGWFQQLNKTHGAFRNHAKKSLNLKPK